MKIKPVLISCILGVVFLVSCSKTKKPKKIIETTTNTTQETTTNQGSSSVTEGGTYDDGEDWGELHS